MSIQKINIILKLKLKDTTRLKLGDNTIMMRNVNDFKLNARRFRKKRHLATRKRQGMIDVMSLNQWKTVDDKKKSLKSQNKRPNGFY